MPKYTNLNKHSSPLGGRPRNPLWVQYEEISSTKVRCKKCLAILAKRIDRAKEHYKKCTKTSAPPDTVNTAEPDLPGPSGINNSSSQSNDISNFFQTPARAASTIRENQVSQQITTSTASDNLKMACDSDLQSLSECISLIEPVDQCIGKDQERPVSRASILSDTSNASINASNHPIIISSMPIKKLVNLMSLQDPIRSKQKG